VIRAGRGQSKASSDHRTYVRVVRKLLDIALGIVTSVAGFLEIGSLVTSAQAGALFGYRLLWAVVLGGACLAFLVEMSGRFAAVSRHTVADAMRERFGFNFFLVPFVVLLLTGVSVLAAELGGAAIALELATGIDHRLSAVAVVLVTWLLLWWGTFAVVEKGVSTLALITVVFAIAAVKAHPRWREVLGGAVPRLSPGHDRGRYWFLAVAILGASISPYLFFFYSSGAIEEKWDASHLTMNRIVSGVGMGFGSLMSVAVVVLGAVVLPGVAVDHYRQLPALLEEVLGRKGYWLFAGALGIACLGAALEVALATAYTAAQGFGWNWGENQKPAQDARFSASYTLVLVAAAAPVVAGVNVLGLTNLTMALTAATLPVAVVPFLLLMNDRDYVGDHGNSLVGNVVVAAIVGLACVLAVVSIPLQVLGG
jgi:Mn2+/Fe2+ NRAMP family transporter